MSLENKNGSCPTCGKPKRQRTGDPDAKITLFGPSDKKQLIEEFVQKFKDVMTLTQNIAVFYISANTQRVQTKIKDVMKEEIKKQLEGGNKVIFLLVNYGQVAEVYDLTKLKPIIYNNHEFSEHLMLGQILYSRDDGESFKLFNDDLARTNQATVDKIKSFIEKN